MGPPAGRRPAQARTLAVAGNARTPTSPIDLGIPGGPGCTTRGPGCRRSGSTTAEGGTTTASRAGSPTTACRRTRSGSASSTARSSSTFPQRRRRSCPTDSRDECEGNSISMCSPHLLRPVRAGGGLRRAGKAHDGRGPDAASEIRVQAGPGASVSSPEHTEPSLTPAVSRRTGTADLRAPRPKGQGRCAMANAVTEGIPHDDVSRADARNGGNC